MTFCKYKIQDLHVLDAGCGTGRYSKQLIELGIGKVTLLDKSLTMLEIAKERLKDEITSKAVVDIVKASLPDLPFPPVTFDAVMFNYVSSEFYLKLVVGRGYIICINKTLNHSNELESVTRHLIG